MSMKSNIRGVALRSMRFVSQIIPPPKKISMTREEAEKHLTDIRSMPTVVSDVTNKADSGLDLSIIVPCYNVEQYVVDCIESILSQKTTFSFEVILVDDGSTDRTLNILKRYEICNDMVRCITQKNGGLSVARNAGLNIATGHYVMFVDSDDLLENDAIQILMSTAVYQQADIVSGAHTTFPQHTPVNTIKSGVATNDEWKFQCPGVAWGKVYKRSLFKDVRFPERLNFEDTIIHFLILPLCRKLIFISDVVYRYRINPNGITRTVAKNNTGIDSIWVVMLLLRKRKAMGLRMDEFFYRFLLRQLGPMTYFRVCEYDEFVIECVFVIAADLLQENIIPTKKLTRNQKLLQKSLIKRNICLWKICSRL